MIMIFISIPSLLAFITPLQILLEGIGKGRRSRLMGIQIAVYRTKSLVKKLVLILMNILAIRPKFVRIVMTLPFLLELI